MSTPLDLQAHAGNVTKAKAGRWRSHRPARALRIFVPLCCCRFFRCTVSNEATEWLAGNASRGAAAGSFQQGRFLTWVCLIFCRLEGRDKSKSVTLKCQTTASSHSCCRTTSPSANGWRTGAGFFFLNLPEEACLTSRRFRSGKRM